MQKIIFKYIYKVRGARPVKKQCGGGEWPR